MPSEKNTGSDAQPDFTSHSVTLEPHEIASRMPMELESQVNGGVYTWTLFSSSRNPMPKYGKRGDVWMKIAPTKHKIHIKRIDGTWVPWCRDWAWQSSPSRKGRQRCCHPWLKERLLAFDGTGIGWFKQSECDKFARIWDGTRKKSKAPSYRSLSTRWIVNHLCDRLFLNPNDIAPSGMRSRSAASCSESSASSSSSASDSPVLVKREEKEEEEGFAKQRKRYRSPLSDHTSSKKPKIKFDDSLRSSTAGSTVPETIQHWLDHQSLPLAHHAELLTTLGITEISYLKAIALTPKHLCDEVIAALREQGVTFVESLVVRNALNALRQSALREPEIAPQSIEAFLARLHPELARHALVFHELEIDTTHFPVLAQLDADSYAEFEDTLSANNLTWVEIFLIRAGIQDYAEAFQEPLLAE